MRSPRLPFESERLSIFAGYSLGFGLLLAGIALTIYDNSLYREQALKEVTLQARVLAASEAASLDFDDPKATQEYLDALDVNPQIDQAAVFDRAGRLVAHYARSPSATIPQSPPAPGYDADGNELAVIAPVVHRERRIGSVYIRASTEPLGRRLPRYGAIILLLTMASLVVAVLALARTRLAASNAKLLTEMEERGKAEDALRQSQKMEAIGQLTGGIAHDFNNMLAIIMGSLSILIQRLERGQTDVLRQAEGALGGAKRAARLTQQLLAFSRRQPLSPAAISPNKLILEMAELMGRTIGEQIRFQTVVGAGTWPIFADQSQLETAILNLILNARDAMPNGGELTLEIANADIDDSYAARYDAVEPGQYVMIAVSDTGAGMTEDIVERAFEPFFTTKQEGKGTGLGLSQVYGFIKQSRGHAKIYSEPGHGTTVKLYLPRAAERARNETPELPRRTARADHSREIVLVVEDQDDVRRVSVEALRDLGYIVRHAHNMRRALEILESNPGIDLLFTDIVMPDGSGRQLADEVRRRWPSIRILFTTGYTRNAIIHNGVLDSDAQVILKPFTVDQLGAKVAQILG